MWWVGDWLRHGEDRWGEMYAEAEAITGLDCGTLRNAKMVAGRYELSLRSDNLPFFTHQCAASLPSAQRANLLAEAEREGLSGRAVLKRVKQMKSDTTKAAEVTDEDSEGNTPAGEVVSVVTEEDREREVKLRGRAVAAAAAALNALKKIGNKNPFKHLAYDQVKAYMRSNP
jgi:hypothetical protein